MRKMMIALLAAVPALVWAATPQRIVLDVQNMTCPVCPITVKKSLEKVAGVSAVSVEFDKKTATVTFDADKTTPAALTETTKNAGYPSTIHSIGH